MDDYRQHSYASWCVTTSSLHVDFDTRWGSKPRCDLLYGFTCMAGLMVIPLGIITLDVKLATWSSMGDDIFDII